MPTRIIDVIAHDIRFPTSLAPDGADAMPPAPDSSAAYVVLVTDRPDGLAGHGLTFPCGRGTEPVSYTHLDVYKRQVRGAAV